MRKFVSVAVVAGVLLALTACAGSPGDSGCTPAFASGSNSQLVSAKGRIGADPLTSFPTPLVAAAAQASIVVEGEGDPVGDDSTVVLQASIYDGATGTALGNTGYGDQGIIRSSATALPAFGAIAQCATVGSRIAAVGTALDLLGADAAASGTLDKDATIVLVVDVQASYLGRANGADQIPQAGFPSVVLAPNGRPGITFPSSEAPTELKIADLKTGTGTEVEEGDSVVLNYTGALWGATDVFDSSWAKGTPAILVAQEASEGKSGVVAGFADALIGAKVGSQVIAIVPPEFGYPTGTAPTNIPDGSTMVFVIDVLGVVE